MKRLSHSGTGQGPKETKSLRKGLQILKTFSADGQELSLTEIASRNRMPKSTASRILGTLTNEGFLFRDPGTASYRLGSELLHLGGLVRQKTNLRGVAIPHMQKVSTQYGELVHLAILNEDQEVVSLEATPSRFNLRSDVHLGGKAELHCTGVGKAILAFLDPKDIRRLLKAKRRKYTANTITGERELLQEIARIRSQGYAVDDMEHEDGVRCIAAPITAGDGKAIGAISISGPATRIGLDRVPKLARSVREVARRISRDLGFALQ